MILGTTQPIDGSPKSDMKLTLQQRRLSHTHVIGGTRKGKSKLLEWMIREDILSRRGLCLLDWHGTLYKDVVSWLAEFRPGVQVTLIDPSKPEYVTGFNPFTRTSGDVSTQVARRISATLKPWGVKNSDEMPTFERICRVLYTFAIEANEPLQHAWMLLGSDNKKLRDHAARICTNPIIRTEWRDLNSAKGKEWRDHVLSTKNRLMRFIASTSVRRFMGLRHNTLDLAAAMDANQVILVNLGNSDYLDRDSARVFASLFLNQFFEAAMRRAGTKDLYFLYLDEFQNYITDDLASSLDQALKGGLHLILAHQHLAQLAEHSTLKDSILTNARIRVVFGGLTVPTAKEMAEEIFLRDINERQVKETYYSKVNMPKEETRTVTSRSTGTTSSAREDEGMALWDGEQGLRTTKGKGSSAGASDGWSHTEVPFLAPNFVDIVSNRAEWSREEKVSRAAEALIAQKPKFCIVRVDREHPQRMIVKNIPETNTTPEDLAEFVRETCEAQGAIPAAEADRIMQEDEERFVALVAEEVDDDFSSKRL